MQGGWYVIPASLQASLILPYVFLIVSSNPSKSLILKFSPFLFAISIILSRSWAGHVLRSFLDSDLLPPSIKVFLILSLVVWLIGPLCGLRFFFLFSIPMAINFALVFSDIKAVACLSPTISLYWNVFIPCSLAICPAKASNH